MKDCIGNDVYVGDKIVYFTRHGSVMENQLAVVEYLPKSEFYWAGRPCILVKRQDAVEKDRFTRKAWLWSLKNAVKVG